MVAVGPHDGSMAWEWLPPVATGVVGVAGIVGSAWTAASARRSQADILRHQFDGESRRQYQADKQALYIKILDELTTVVELSIRRIVLEKKGDATDEELAELRSVVDKHVRQMMVVGRLRAEVAVLAGPAMAAEYSKMTGVVGAFIRGNKDGAIKEVTAALAVLTETMHADLRSDLGKG
jgi:hypothetical protein